MIPRIRNAAWRPLKESFSLVTRTYDLHSLFAFSQSFVSRSGHTSPRATLLDGRAVAAEWQQEIAFQAREIKSRGGRAPGLGIILVGNRPDSLIYVSRKQEACEQAGIRCVIRRLPISVPQMKLQEAVKGLCADSTIDGLIVQLPLPPHVNEESMIDDFDPSKDVDGFHPMNVGRTLMRGRSAKFVPCTALGCVELLRRSHIPIKDRSVAIVGDSNIVGMPLAMLLRDEGASTVTVVHKTSYSSLFRQGSDGESGANDFGHNDKNIVNRYQGKTRTDRDAEGYDETPAMRAEAGACLPRKPGPRPYEVSYASALRNAYPVLGERYMDSEYERSHGQTMMETVKHGGRSSLHEDLAELKRITSTADILVVAVGYPRLITADWIKPGAVVVDVGINIVDETNRNVRKGDESLQTSHATEGPRRLAIEPPSHLHVVGDVDFDEACEVASAISPVPGGVGPMTIAAVLNNTVRAAAGRLGVELSR